MEAHRRAVGRGLRDELAVAGAAEAPAVVDALEPPGTVDPSFGEWSESVRTAVIEHLPLAVVAVPPNDHVDPDHLLAVWDPFVQVTHRHHRIPLGVPVELPLRRGGLGLGFRRER